MRCMGETNDQIEVQVLTTNDLKSNQEEAAGKEEEEDVTNVVEDGVLDGVAVDENQRSQQLQYSHVRRSSNVGHFKAKDRQL